MNETIAYLHILNTTDGLPENKPRRQLTFNKEHPFGVAGEDFSSIYHISSYPLTIHEGRDEIMNYPPGPYVLLSAVERTLYSTHPVRGTVIEAIRQLPQYNPPDSQAEELLTKVCKEIETEGKGAKYEGYASIGFDSIPTLEEWWTKHKPKSEREQKIEKIKKILDRPIHGPDIAELILKALGQ